MRAARRPRLLREADGAEKREREKTGKPGGGSRRFARVLAASENPSRLQASSAFWTASLRISAAVLAGRETARFDGAFYPVLCAGAAVFAALALDALAGRIVRREPERAAAFLFPAAALFALPLRPFLFFAEKISLGLKSRFEEEEEGEGMTEDDLRDALSEGEKSGIVESGERSMVESIFYLGDRPLGAFMTHRSGVIWLDAASSPEEIRRKTREGSGRQRCFPVADGTLDAIVGAAYREDIILDLCSPHPRGLRAVMKKPLFAPETMPALKAFESFRRGDSGFLFVMDEYGGFAGMVSVLGLVEEIVGGLVAPPGGAAEKAEIREDGSWVVPGGLNIDEAAETLSLPALDAPGGYHTLAGFVLSLSGELPRPGDSFPYRGFRFTVLAMDGNRIDRIGIARE